MNMLDVVDFHSHILPMADHGSSSVDESMCQLSFAKKCGVSRIVATPHFYPQKDSVDVFIERRSRCYHNLEQRLTEDLPKIVLGAEVLVCDNIENLPGLSHLCIGNSNTLLLELPFSDFKREYCYSVADLKEKGYNIVLAHADRYDKDNIEQLLRFGAQIQLNADSLNTFLKDKRLYEWMSREKVVALGSDIHGSDAYAYKRFSVAKKKVGSYINYIKLKSDELWNSFVSEGQTALM